MKVALGFKIKNGPFGGGNQFAQSLYDYLIKRGIEVVFDLNDKDIDLILLTDPRTNSTSTAFGIKGIFKYIKKINSGAILVHRVNECDERKGTKDVNQKLFLANQFMDFTVYIASWLRDLFRNQKYTFTQNYKVILNGADKNIFQYRKKEIKPGEKIRLVTHHWSNNKMKGWDVYSYLDELMTNEPYKSSLEFHYIGQVPNDVKINNIVIHEPCHGKELADLIHHCHIYLTASICEPAGMHHIEGALCGLPLLFRKSGALPEYCTGYGVAFNGVDDFQTSLNSLIKDYSKYSDVMSNYSNSSTKMCQEYLNLFLDLIEKKKEILAKRGNKFSKVNYLRYYLRNKFNF